MFYILGRLTKDVHRIITRCPRWKTKLYSSYEGTGKTTVTILNKDTSYLLVNSYSQVGFTLNSGVTILGPMILFPRTVLQWNISGYDNIDEETLTIFPLLVPKIDLIVIGFGEAENNNPELRKKLFNFSTKYKMNFELLPTERACSTFNFLNSERRSVAAALIPPRSIPMFDDIAPSRYRRKESSSETEYQS